MDSNLINDLKNSLNLPPIVFNFGSYVVKTNVKPSWPKSDRFVVNLYEKPSFPKKRLSLSKDAFLKLKYDKKNNNVYRNFSRKNGDLSCRRPRAKMTQFEKLKKQRDVECLKIKEASNVLQMLNTISPYGSWTEKLLAEKVLLTSGYLVDQFVDKIRSEHVEIQGLVDIGTIAIEQFKFNLEDITTTGNMTEFFILLLANGINVKTSKITRAFNRKVAFDEKFEFPIDANFNVKVQIFSLILKDVSKLKKLITRLLQKKLQLQSTSSLQYKNLNTSIYEDTNVLKTSFKLRGEISIDSTTMHEERRKLNLVDPSYKNLAKPCSFFTQLKDFTARVTIKSLLTVGYLLQDAIIWDRRWCVLDNTIIKIYYAPEQEDFVEAAIVINLDKSQSRKVDVVKKIMCNRTKCFILDIINNNIVRKYFFKADNDVNLNMWISNINTAFDLLHLKQILLNNNN